MVDFGDDEGRFHIDTTRIREWSSDVPLWRASTCISCLTSTVWRDDEQIYPVTMGGPLPHRDMPEGARELYNEARAVLPLSRRAAAALARAALESLLKELGVGKAADRLDERIAALQSVVRGPLWQLLTALRFIGNTSLHGEDEQAPIVGLYLSGEAAEVVDPYFGAINALVDELRTQPAQAAALYEMIPENVRKSAEDKAARHSAP